MKVQTNGYYRFPAVHKDQVVFISEDDLWQVTLKGGVARRLTSNLGPISHPKFSEDGKWIAFTGREEGNPEIYLMPAEGGLAERITYLGCMTYTVGWHEGKIVFASDSSRPFMGQVHLHTIDPKTKEIEKLPFGPAQAVSFNKKCAVLGREIGEPSRWKRYRGGRAGKLWVDREGKGEFGHLKNLEGNIAFPMWVDERIFYVSDQAGFGNIFSCLSDGTDNKQHTRHKKFYVRSADTDGKNIVYQNGADLYCYNIESDKSKIIEVDFFSPRVQLKQKFTSAQQYLDNYAINSDGSSLAVVTRGKAFSFGNWEGPVTQHGDRHRVRYRLIRWMPDDKSIVLTSDVGGVDRIEFYFIETNQRANVIDKLDIGRPQDIKISPDGKKICLMNHRHELSLIDIASKSLTKIDQSQSGFLRGFNWSPDSNWIAYCKHVNHQQCIVKLHDVKKKEIHDITRALLIDFEPVFDPKGRYLYFLASRVFDPVWDNMHFDYNFPRGERPFLITLRKDEASPFVPKTKGFGAALNNDKKGDEPENKKNEEGKGDDNDKDKQPEELRIDFEGIQDRVIQFPVAEGLYSSIAAKDDKVFYTSLPISGTLAQNWGDTNPNAKGTIKVYDFNKLEESTFSSAISNFQISGNGAALAYRSVNRLRVVDASHDPKQDLPKENTTSRKTGWINLNRLKLAIDPLQEWKQMYKEAWRLQRDYYWVENMSSIDWKKIYDRYYPLLNRVGSRIEFSDLLWEMQGELGTSHAYEMGGDHKKTPMYIIGHLGATIKWNSKRNAFEFSKIANADSWGETCPPLFRPGINIAQGMLLLEVNGVKLSLDFPPGKALMCQTGEEMQLVVSKSDRKEKRTVVIKPTGNETGFWYRDWVESNRSYVHKKTKGKVGYIHIPNMSPVGYAEFHRYFLSELHYDGLIIDVRFNGGGHVSPLILEKLARKRFGWTKTRWMGQTPKPRESPNGPMVALTNQSAGSDGDIFSHGFKYLKLGKLIGTRTWGGVVGIMPRNVLADKTLTTQPEFSNWFFDVGYGVENYGTDPDIFVEIKPQDYASGKDPQLDRSLTEVLKEIKRNPPVVPNFEEGLPDLSLPK